MASGDRLARFFLGLTRLLIALNVAVVVAAVVVFVASFVGAGMLEARIAAKYGGRVSTGDAMAFVRFLIVLMLPVGWALHRLFGALAAMLRTVLAGDPFVADNAARLRTIGWALLAIQLIDLALGGAMHWAARRGLEVLDWQPALMGWLAVLVAFVLARVFTVGTRLREDVEGTV